MPRLGMRFSSPGGVSSPMPSTWLSVNHKLLSLGLNARPEELRMPVASTRRSVPSRLKLTMPPMPTLRYRSTFSGGLHVERLPERDVDPVVGADHAGARGVVVRLFLGRNQFALLDDRKRDRIGALHEVFGRREHHHAVALGDEQEAVGRVAGAGGNVELHARAEFFDRVGDVVHVAVIDGIDGVLAGSDPHRGRVAAHRHAARIGHDGEQLDLEARPAA